MINLKFLGNIMTSSVAAQYAEQSKQDILKAQALTAKYIDLLKTRRDESIRVAKANCDDDGIKDAILSYKASVGLALADEFERLYEIAQSEDIGVPDPILYDEDEEKLYIAVGEAY